ncbi:conserved protein, unknown function [Hepatocystis sp. ex Piliocolobus tephrosceles]|nr:conserved protein, unknown function [Hepatocystis sp. ex Piliocolobus tephrosceles]
MDFFSWKTDNIKIEEEVKKALELGVIKSEDLEKLNKVLKEFRALKFDNLNYHSDKCLLARELIIIYMSTYKKHIESLKVFNTQITLKYIKRTVLSINNLICNINEQILKCFYMLKSLYDDIVKLNNQYLADYCLFAIIDETLNILSDEKQYSSNSTIWGLSSFLALILSNYNKAYFIYIGIISYKCIYTIPIFIDPSSIQNMSKENLHNIILKENDEFLYTNFSRIESYVKLHLSVYIVLNDTREIWSFLSEVFNSAYRRKTCIYFCQIYAALEVSTYYCKITFSHFFDYLLILLKIKLMPILTQEFQKNPPAPNVEKIVEYYIQKIHMEYLSDNIKLSIPEEIVIIPDEKLLYLD